jgi:hypothetical protein
MNCTNMYFAAWRVSAEDPVSRFSEYFRLRGEKWKTCERR